MSTATRKGRPTMNAPTAPLPKAAADQLTVFDWETDLVALARVNHATVAWWHGYRAGDDGYGSVCYICDRFIANWSGNSGPPMAARKLIDTHKSHHRAGTTVLRVPRKK